MHSPICMPSKEVVKRPSKEASVRKRRSAKLVHEGEYVAEVEIEFVYTDDGWSPYFSPADAEKLDNVRDAIRRGDVKTTIKYERVYSLTPIAP